MLGGLALAIVFGQNVRGWDFTRSLCIPRNERLEPGGGGRSDALATHHGAQRWLVENLPEDSRLESRRRGGGKCKQGRKKGGGLRPRRLL